MTRVRHGCQPEVNVITSNSIANLGQGCCIPVPKPPQPEPCVRCGNLVQDPSFEASNSYWWTDNTYIADTSVFEGTAVARLGPGVASVFQELSIKGASQYSMFFSFNAFSPSENNNNGTLTAEVVWLDKENQAVGTGLRMFVPNDRINNFARITFFAITDRPPAGTVAARVMFSKGQGLENDIILIDGVILAAIYKPDLVQNGDFEAGLLGWEANPDTAFISDHKLSLEGAGHVRTHFNGTLTQDISIRQFPKMPFLFSFAVLGEGPVTLNVRIEWLNSSGDAIGSGLNLSIPDNTLPSQGNYLSYLNITDQAVPGTATARIIFSAGVPNSEFFLALDQVLFAPVITDNLIKNPSFEDGLNHWVPTYITLVPPPSVDDYYEGQAVAGIGQIGGSLWQEVYLKHAAGHCFLFSTGLGFRRAGSAATFGTMLIKVIWLDRDENEIGLGLCLIATSDEVPLSNHQWVPYAGVTEPAPPGTVKARIQFTKTDSTNGYIEIDNVLLGRLT